MVATIMEKITSLVKKLQSKTAEYRHLQHLTLTQGEMFGWDDKRNRNHFYADNDKQLPLMMQIYNRVAYYNNECECGWLRNATKKEFSSAYFAVVSSYGNAYCNGASNSYGVRPEIWLVK